LRDAPLSIVSAFDKNQSVFGADPELARLLGRGINVRATMRKSDRHSSPPENGVRGNFTETETLSGNQSINVASRTSIVHRTGEPFARNEEPLSLTGSAPQTRRCGMHSGISDYRVASLDSTNGQRRCPVLSFKRV